MCDDPDSVARHEHGLLNTSEFNVTEYDKDGTESIQGHSVRHHGWVDFNADDSNVGQGQGQGEPFQLRFDNMNFLGAGSEAKVVTGKMVMQGGEDGEERF